MRNRQVIRGIILNSENCPWKKATDMQDVKVTVVDVVNMHIELEDVKANEKYAIEYIMDEEGNFDSSECTTEVLIAPVVEEPVVEEPVVEEPVVEEPVVEEPAV